MKKLNVIGLLAIAIIFFASCGGSETKKADQKDQQKEVTEEVVAAEEVQNDVSEDMMALGKQIYDSKCIACHQANAEGLSGTFPPLKNSDYLLADLPRGVLQTLKGSEEEMIVNGASYTTAMPPQVETLEEAVAVINYVLKEFNEFSDDKLVKMEDVKDLFVK